MSVESPRLIAITMPAKNSESLSAFYDNVFKLNFGRTIKDSNKAYQTWLSAGVKFNIGDRYHENETTMIHIAVPDLAAYAKQVVASGGKVMTDKPVALQYHAEFVNDYRDKFEQFKFGTRDQVSQSLGTFHVCSDPQGNRFGIIQLEPWAAKLFAAGVITKMEIAEQAASLGHAKKLIELEAR